jgi:tetratricopeptide (TPR) repeat protein
MVCSECGTRSLPDARFCVRCGARVVPAEQPEEAAPPREPSPAEQEALAARELLAAGRVDEAEEAAKRAVILEPAAVLPHMVLGEIAEHRGALDDALRSYRAAAELAPDDPEARAKAEDVRRQITHPIHATEEPPRTWLEGLLALVPRRLIPVAAGVVTALLVFTVGAAAIVARTSPVFETRREFAQQMALGRRAYQDGRYAEAATAFRQAQQLSPGSAEAGRRLADAERMAGLPASGPGTSVPPVGDETRIAAANQSATPGMTAFRTVWVGPGPSAKAAAGLTASGPAVPPPYIPAPLSNGSRDVQRPDLPPLPPLGPKSARPFETIEGGSRLPPEEEPPPAKPVQPAERGSKPKDSRLTITFDNPPQRAPSATPVRPPTPQPSAAEAARRAADRLWAAGQWQEAGKQYADARDLYRTEAGRGGSGRAARTAAADSCEKARQVCEARAH